MYWNLSRTVLAGLILLLAAGAAGAAPPSFESRELAMAAESTPVGGAVLLTGIRVADTDEPAAFALERFQVFTPDAKITVHGDEGETVLPAPDNAYFRGTVEGEPGSRVFLAALADGTVQGIITRQGDYFMIGSDEDAAKARIGGSLEMRRVDPVTLKAGRGGAFNCGNDKLPLSLPAGESLGLGLAPEEETSPAKLAGVLHTARVAIETDFEYYALFNNTTNATNYIGNLIGYSSTIYSAEISTTLAVQSVSLWTTGAGSDPWSQTNTTCGLMEFGRYWNLNHGGDSRTIAHFLSGKGLGGGVAWVGVLCSGAFNASTSCPGLPTDASWGGAYGFTASISGAFSIVNPTVMWDIYAVSHEIGHNFNSPHAHCYNGLEGNASPIDQCLSGEVDSHGACFSGTAALPGPAGAGSGTIMSYCHLRRSSYTDVGLSFGTGHPFGVAPGREATRMTNHVVSRAASNPSCLAFAAASSIFSDGFESGKTLSWQ